MYFKYFYKFVSVSIKFCFIYFFNEPIKPRILVPPIPSVRALRVVRARYSHSAAPPSIPRDSF